LYTDTAIVFGYPDSDTHIPENLSPQMQKSSEFLQKIGEKIKIYGFNKLSLADNPKTLGFGLHDNLSPRDIKKCYLQGRTDGCFEYVYFACAVVE
jgi:hypothetical protein